MSLLDHLAAGEELDIPTDLGAHVADEWLRVRAAHGITTAAIEQTVVHDGWRVATNIDRIDVLPDGRHVCADIKSAANVVKAAYLLQLAVGASSVKYDPDSGERTPWPVAIDRTTGHVWHFPIGEAIKAHAEGRPLPTWTLVTVDLAHGFALGEALHALKTDVEHKECFTTIAAPTSPVVEQRAGEVERTANAEASPATLDDLRAEVDTFTTEQVAFLTTYIREHNLDRTSVADMAGAMTIARGAAATVDRYPDTFDDVQTVATRRDTEVTSPTVRSVKPDEGDTILPAQVEAIRTAYAALDDTPQLWVSNTAANLRLHPDHGGIPSVRRFEIMRGLLAIAPTRYGCDLQVQTVVRRIYRDAGIDISLAHVTASEIVDSLTVDEARRFAVICVDIADSAATDAA